MRTVRIFLSSPGDCNLERDISHSVAAKLNADPVIATFARIEVIAWDWAAGVPMDALASPQVSVNDHLPVPEDCDVFIGIFRCRFGSPLPSNEFRKDDGSLFLSGSEYEFDRAWKARRRGAVTPEILMYRLNGKETLACMDCEQLQRLNSFFASPPFQNHGKWTGSVNQFQDTESFEKTLDGHLRVLLSRWHSRAKVPLHEQLKQHYLRLEHDAGPRYTSKKHIDSEVNHTFDWLLARPSAIQELDNLLANIWKDLDCESLSLFKNQLQDVALKLHNDPHWITPPKFDSLAVMLDELSGKAWEIASSRRLQNDPANATEQYKNHQLNNVARYAEEAATLIRTYAEFTKRRVLLLTGAAGQGKTHTLVHEVKCVLESGGIAIGVLAQTLSASGDLRNALMQTWNCSDSFETFLDDLENKSALLGRRALIAIDALNESPNRSRWKNELNGLIQEILSRPHLTVALSVRTDYRAYVLPDTDDDTTELWVEHKHKGFSGIEPDALRAYCAHYGVTAPVAPPIGELSNPLYVQLLVKSLKKRATNSHWLPSWLEVWNAWIEQIESDARGRLIIDPSRKQPVRRCLNKLADTMIASGRFYLLRQTADEIAKGVSGLDTLIGFLCSAGALIDRIENDDEMIEFGFERLSDTFFVHCLLTRLFKGKRNVAERRLALEIALSPRGELSALTTPDCYDSPLFYRRYGLLAALCLLVPSHVGAELPEFIPAETPDSRHWVTPDSDLRNAFTDSMRWRCQPEEFARDEKSLWQMYRERGSQLGRVGDLDELMRLALIPRHPFAMDKLLHPWLLGMESVGERDAEWSVNLVALWRDESSNLSVLIRWAIDSNLTKIHKDIAVPAALLLAWACTSSQQKLREMATRGLTRVLVACPEILSLILEDILKVDDDYVVESTLIAIWGVMIDGSQPEYCQIAAQKVYSMIFGNEYPRCHLTIRHYARRVVEVAFHKDWFHDIDLSVIRTPYKSALPLSQVPDDASLRALDSSQGFRNIIGSALGRDFYWYVLGATSGSKPFSSKPLPHSNEPVRAYKYGGSETKFSPENGIFDIPLVARFIVWNSYNLGWSAKRFDTFDTGYETRSSSRIDDSARTERIGKKYQWISWQKILAFLSDNYHMTDDPFSGAREYDTPHQISYIKLSDPSRWLYLTERHLITSNRDDFWRVPSLPQWPSANVEDVIHWGTDEAYDLPAADVLSYVPELPSEWGDGPWIRIAAEHCWTSPKLPGTWGIGQDLDTNIWWQLTPALIRACDLTTLLDSLNETSVCERLEAISRIELEGDWNLQLSEWPGACGDLSKGIDYDGNGGSDAWLPVPWMHLIGECGHPDRSEESGPTILPWPRIFQDWGLELDIESGVVRQGNTVVFGVASLVMDEKALFAQRDVLINLLEKHNLALVWWLRGERRAFMPGFSSYAPHALVWIDSRGVAYLGKDGLIQVGMLSRKNSR